MLDVQFGDDGGEAFPFLRSVALTPAYLPWAVVWVAMIWTLAAGGRGDREGDELSLLGLRLRHLRRCQASVSPLAHRGWASSLPPIATGTSPRFVW